MASRATEANVAIIFGCLGAAYLLSAPYTNWYLMPFWLYFRMMFPISFPFGITTLLGTILVLADRPTAGGALLLASSLANGAAAVLFGVGFVEPLAGATCVGIAGVLAIYAAHIGRHHTTHESVPEVNSS